MSRCLCKAQLFMGQLTPWGPVEVKLKGDFSSYLAAFQIHLVHISQEIRSDKPWKGRNSAVKNISHRQIPASDAPISQQRVIPSLL